MIVVIVNRVEGKRSGKARRWVSRWLPEVAPGVFVGTMAAQGMRRFLGRLEGIEGVEVWQSSGAVRVWRSDA